jgi:methylglutamate dehydrogenase subunit B
MIVPCPHCGTRDSSEFYFRGEATSHRPDYDEGTAAFAEYVYGRANHAGPQKEHWYHAAGCRNWLLVERDTRTHAILSVMLAVEQGS